MTDNDGCLMLLAELLAAAREMDGTLTQLDPDGDRWMWLRFYRSYRCLLNLVEGKIEP